MQPEVNKFYYFPLKVLLTFLVFTCLLFAFGAIMWPVSNPLTTFTFLAIVHFSFYLGYRYGVKIYRIKKKKNKLRIDPISLFSFCAVVYLLWAIPTLLSRWGVGSLSPSTIIDKVTEGINNPKVGYLAKIDAVGTERSLYSYANFFISGITYMVIPLAAAFWKKLNVWQKTMALAVLFIEVILWIGIGTNKGVFDVFLIISFTAIAGNWQAVYNNRKKIIIYFTIFLVVVIFYFLNNIFARTGVTTDNVNFQEIQIMFTGTQDVRVNANNPLIKSFSPLTQTAIVTLEGYLTIGYYCMSLALKEPYFDCTYGFGNSWQTIDLFKLFTGKDLLPSTYLHKIELHNGVDPMIAWHSIYTWIANDVSFFLVPLVIFFIGRFFATAWLDSLNRNSVFSPVICSMFVLMVFYFFANNQVLSFSFFPFLLSFYLWRKSR
jgi:hypothetical protein